jgi:hypothetical protein
MGIKAGEDLRDTSCSLLRCELQYLAPKFVSRCVCLSVELLFMKQNAGNMGLFRIKTICSPMSGAPEIHPPTH